MTEEINEDLCRPATHEEIKKAFFSLGDLKAPGGDGLNGLFFQNHWDVIRLDICEAILSFFQQGQIPEEVNETIVVVIPKVHKPE